MTVSRFVIRLIYTISSSSLPPTPGEGGEGWEARATPLGARVARAFRFRIMRAVRVEMALTMTIAAIQSGSCSYVMSLQSETTGITVPFAIAATFGECACVRAIYINSQHGCFVMYDIYTRAIYYLHHHRHHYHHHRHHIAEDATIYMYLQLFTKSPKVTMCLFANFIVSIGQRIDAIRQYVTFVVECVQTQFRHLYSF